MRRNPTWLLAMLLAMVLAIAAPVCDSGGDDDDDDPGDDTDDNTDDDDDDTGDGAPTITNTKELPDTSDATGPYLVSATVTDDVALTEVNLVYVVDHPPSSKVAMTAAGDVYAAYIPGQVVGSLVQYYVSAKDTSGNVVTDPPDAPIEQYSFLILTPQTYEYDDGTAEDSVEFTGDGSLGLRVITPADYPSVLTQVSVWLSGISGLETNYELVVFADATGGMPDDATEAWASGPRTDAPPDWPLGEWVGIDLGDASAATRIEEGTWAVGVRWLDTDSQGPFLGVDDSAGTDPNSVLFEAITGTWGTLEDRYGGSGFHWQWMIRAQGLE